MDTYTQRTWLASLSFSSCFINVLLRLKQALVTENVIITPDKYFSPSGICSHFHSLSPLAVSTHSYTVHVSSVCLFDTARVWANLIAGSECWSVQLQFRCWILPFVVLLIFIFVLTFQDSQPRLMLFWKKSFTLKRYCHVCSVVCEREGGDIIPSSTNWEVFLTKSNMYSNPNWTQCPTEKKCAELTNAIGERLQWAGPIAMGMQMRLATDLKLMVTRWAARILSNSQILILKF